MHSHALNQQPTDTVSQFRAPDGGMLTLEASGYDLSDPWSATVRITVLDEESTLPTHRQIRGFDLAYHGNYDFVIAEVLRGDVVEHLSLQGGELLIAHAPDQGLAVWRGPWHEAAAWLPDPATPTEFALELFGGLTFTDTPLGLVIESQTPEYETVAAVEVIKLVPGAGYLDVKTAQAGFEMIPTWAGAPAPAGEVWRLNTEATEDDPARSVFILATETTVTVLSGAGEQKSQEEPRLNFLERLTRLSWEQR